MKRGKRITAFFACAALVCTGVLLPANLQTAYADEAVQTDGVQVSAYDTTETEGVQGSAYDTAQTDGAQVSVYDTTETDSSLTYEYEGHTFTYTVDDDGEAVTVTGCADENAASTVTSLVLPEEIGGLPVESLASQAFYEYTALEEVTLPEGLTTLGSSAFCGCSALTYIDLPDGIKSIPRSCFRNCTALTGVDLPEDLTTILDYAFAYCSSLERLYLPDKLNIIYTFAFSYCINIEYIRFPANSISMRDGNFLQSENVDTVEFAEGCTSVNSFTSTDGFISDTSGIDFFATVRKLILPSTLTSLNGLTNFTSLEEIEFAEGNTTFALYENCLYDADYTTLQYVMPTVEAVTFHPSCTTIASGAFTGCSSLTEVTVPDTVTTVESTAFSSCAALETVTIPESVTSIGAYALSYCTSLTDVSFYLDGALYHYTGTNSQYVKEITDLTITDASGTAAEITDEALYVIRVSYVSEWMEGTEYTYIDAALETVSFPAGTVSIADGWFDNMVSLTAIEVAEDNTTYFAQDGVLYSYADGAASGQTDGCTLVRYPLALGAVELADGLAAIGDSAFYGCTAVKAIEFADTVTAVGAKAFYECEDLTIQFGSGLTDIGDEAFCYSYNSVVYLPESVTSIGTDAFHTGDGSLTAYCVAGSYAESYMIANGVAYGTWDGADTDTAVLAAEETTEDGTGTDTDTSTGTEDSSGTDAKGAAVGTKVTVGKGVYQVTSSDTVTYVKAAKANLTKVTIPATVAINGKTYKVTAVKASALKNAKKLKTVVIGKNVKTIGKNAFYGCKNLKKITFKGTGVKTIGKKAFKGVSKKAVVKVPKAKKAAYKKLLKKAGLPAAAKLK